MIYVALNTQITKQSQKTDFDQRMKAGYTANECRFSTTSEISTIIPMLKIKIYIEIVDNGNWKNESDYSNTHLRSPNFTTK